MRTWDFEPRHLGAELCFGQNNTRKWTLLVKREGGGNIWHNMMELWQVIVSLDILQISIEPSTQEPYLRRKDIQRMSLVFEDDGDSSIDELWTMVIGKSPIRKSQMEPGCLGNVILPLPGGSAPFWQSHWERRDCHSTSLIDAFLVRVYRHLSLTPVNHKDEETTVTIINRNSTRRIYGITEHLENLRRRWPKLKFQVLDFAGMTLREQIRIAQETDVLIGAIGAGLTHILFLPPESSVVQLMTANAEYTGFRNLAKLRGMHYFTAHSQTQQEWEAAHTHGTIDNRHKSRKYSRRNWQSDEWLYYSADAFQTLVDAAIYAQLNRGLHGGDTTPVGFN
jgi:EGF domain-specific O-GlcNAc transferase